MRKEAVIEKFLEASNTITELEYLNHPVTKEEFVHMYMDFKKTNERDTRQMADEVYEAIGKHGGMMTRYNAHLLINMETEDTNNDLILTHEAMLKAGPVVIPNHFPITPYPNLDDYVPNDYYDLRPGPSAPINNSRVKTEWFDASPTLKNELAQYQYPKRLPWLKNSRSFTNMLDFTSNKSMRDYAYIKLHHMPVAKKKSGVRHAPGAPIEQQVAEVESPEEIRNKKMSRTALTTKDIVFGDN